MTKETILITGVAGFIGSALARSLLADGHEVLGLDNFDLCTLGQDVPHDEVHHIKCLRMSSLITQKRFKYFCQDIAQEAGIQLGNNCPDRIIHLAGMSGIARSQKYPKRCVHTNVTGFMNVLDLANDSRTRVKQVLYASSSSVYGNYTGGAPMRESDVLQPPASVYAATKRTTEMLAHTNAINRQNCAAITGLRFFSVYGEEGRPDMAPWLFTAATMHNKPIPMYDNGEWRRDFTYIGDVVAIIKKLMKCYHLPPILNVGCGDPVSGIDMAARIAGYFNKTVKFPLQPKRDFDVGYTHADTTLLQQHIGKYEFKPFCSLIWAFAGWYESKIFEIS